MFKHCFQVVWSILEWVQIEGCMNVLTMVAVLRPDVTSSLWLLIGPHPLTLDANWLKIPSQGCREGPDSMHVLNVPRLPESF